MDHIVVANIPIAVIFVYAQPKQDATRLIPFARLQSALARLLDYYPHLTGRIVLNTDDNSPEVQNIGTGANLVEATCDAALDEIPHSGPRLKVTDLPNGGIDLLPVFEPVVGSIYPCAPLSVQHTRFACGSVALGFRVSHFMCDADGVFQLVRDLAELYRGGPSAHLTAPPHIRPFMSDVVRDPTAPVPPTAMFQLAPSMETGGGLDLKPATGALPPPPTEGRVLRFSVTELGALKALATDAASPSEWVSTFDALAAHLYQRIYAARVEYALAVGADPALLSTDMLSPVNWRSADRLALPPRYFANAVICAIFTTSPEELATAPLSRVARIVHDGLRSLTPTEATAALHWICSQPDKRRIMQNFRYANGGFMLSQWCKTDAYVKTDFDVDQNGQPVAPLLSSTPFTPISNIDGLGYVTATEEQLTRAPGETAAVDVCLALAAPIWKILDKDPLFRRFAE